MPELKLRPIKRFWGRWNVDAGGALIGCKRLSAAKRVASRLRWRARTNRVPLFANYRDKAKEQRDAATA